MESKLCVKAFGITCALLWGASVLVVGALNIYYPDYGVEFLGLVSSVYPGYEAAPNWTSVGIGTLYALLDGLIGGAVFAFLYNLISACKCKKAA